MLNLKSLAMFNPIEAKTITRALLPAAKGSAKAEIKLAEQLKSDGFFKEAFSDTQTYSTSRNTYTSGASNPWTEYKAGESRPVYETLRATNFKPVRFQKAKNIEDAKQFASQNFGIFDYDVDNVEVANYVNSSLNKIVNKTRGSAILPKTIRYERYAEKNYIARVSYDSETLLLNKNYFENIDEYITKRLLKKKNPTLEFKTYVGNPYIHTLNRYKRLYDQGKLSLTQKKDFFELIDHHYSFSEHVLSGKSDLVIGYALKDGKKVVHNGKTITAEEFAKLSLQEKTDIAQDIAKAYANEGNMLHFKGQTPDMFIGAEDSIFHEIGHLNHHKAGQLEYGSLTLEKIEEQRKKATANGRKLAVPEYLEKFLSKEGQETANLVSFYAPTSINEFVAEVYKYLIAGVKLPKSVTDMYVSLKGPVVYR